MYNENKFEKGHPYCPPVYGNETCNTTEIKEILEVLVPVTVAPEVEVGNAAVTVVGEPCVRPLPCSSLSRNGICKFLATQNCVCKCLSLLMPLQEQMTDYQQIVLKIDAQDNVDSNQNLYIS